MSRGERRRVEGSEPSCVPVVSCAYDPGRSIAPGASLRLYVGGTASFTVTDGQGIFNQTGNAINCQVFGLPSCSQVSLAGNSTFLGVIYAPNARLTLSGTTNAPLEATGACVAGSIRLGGDVNFHYDENLQRVGPVR